MKKTIFFISIFLISSVSIFAQLKIAYVDSDAIMKNYADAQDARQKLDAQIQEWQAELNKMENEWKTKYDDYEKRKLIMSDQVRTETEDELVKLERKAAEYREKKFGTNGELFQKQDEIMKPIQNKVFALIKKVAEEDGYDYVFDRSGDVMLLYAKDQYDLTAKILDRLKQE